MRGGVTLPFLSDVVGALEEVGWEFGSGMMKLLLGAELDDRTRPRGSTIGESVWAGSRLEEGSVSIVGWRLEPQQWAVD